MYVNVSEGLLENKEFRFNVSRASNVGHRVYLQSAIKNTYYLVHFLL